MKPRKLARTTTSESRMRKLLASGDPRIAAALLENPRLPSKLRKQISKIDKPAKSKKKQDKDKKQDKKRDKKKDKKHESGHERGRRHSRKLEKTLEKKQDSKLKHHHGKRHEITASAQVLRSEPVQALPAPAFDPAFDLKPIRYEPEPSAPTVPERAPLLPPAAEVPAAAAPAETTVASFRPIAPVVADRPTKSSLARLAAAEAAISSTQPAVIDRRTSYEPDKAAEAAKPTRPTASTRMATVTSIAPIAATTPIPAPDGVPTLQDSLNRVLAAFKKEAAAAGRQMGPGTPGEIVNAFLWVSRQTSTSGGDKAQYTSDWIIFTAYRVCFARKSGFFRKGEYRVFSRAQVKSVDVNVASFADTKDPLQKPYTFVTLNFNMADGSSTVRHIYIDRTELRNSPALTRTRERLTRIANLGWPLVEGSSWDALAESEPIADDDSGISTQAH